MFDGLTDHARIAVALAQHAAERLGLPNIGDDMLLVGLAQEKSVREITDIAKFIC